MKILVLEGDGIGSEIIKPVYTSLDILNTKFNLKLKLDAEEIGLSRLAKSSSTMPENFLDKVKLYDGIILGPLSTLEYPKYGDRAINVSSFLRKELDLYANIRPSLSFENISKVKNMDLVIVRENTEGFFADRNMHLGSGDMMVTEDVAISIRKITTEACRKVLKVGFELANQRRKKVAVIHKCNTLKYSDGLFLKVARDISQLYPHIELTNMLIDATAARLITHPESFDILVTTNLFGDILSDEAAALSGSLGIAGSLNLGNNYALAQAVHGSAPDIAGKNQANPIGILTSTAMLLQWYGQKSELQNFMLAHQFLIDSIKKILHNPKTRTADLGGSFSTTDFTNHICSW